MHLTPTTVNRYPRNRPRQKSILESVIPYRSMISARYNQAVRFSSVRAESQILKKASVDYNKYKKAIILNSNRTLFAPRVRNGSSTHCS